MDIKEAQFKEGNYDRHPWEEARFYVIYKFLKQYIPSKLPTVLDIGCGDAFVLQRLAQKAPHARFIGIDRAFNEEIIEKNNKSSNSHITFLQSVDDVSQTNEKADIVLLLDVIEHIEHVDPFLAELKSSPVIHENTVFIITVPSFSFLYVTRDRWLGHFRRYTLKSLNTSLIKNGYNPLSSVYFFTCLIIPRMVTKLAECFHKPKIDSVKGIGDWKGNKAINWIIYNILILDFKISSFFYYFGIRLPGLSCLTICKKQ